MTYQVGGELNKKEMELEQQEGGQIVEHGVQETPDYEKNKDKKYILTIDLNQDQLKKCLEELDSAMIDFCKEYDIPDELFTILQEDGLIAFGRALAEEDMDTFYNFWMSCITVITPFIGMGISKIGTKIEQKLGKSALGKELHLTGSVLAYIPMILFLGRTAYDDFFEDIRYMGTWQENAERTGFDVVGLLCDLFLVPGGIKEKLAGVIISGLFLLIDGITEIYNYFEGKDQVKKLQVWYDQQMEYLENWHETMKTGKNEDNNIYIDIL